MSQANLERLKLEANRATEAFLSEWPTDADDGLYAPIHYLMSLGGKRLRAVLALSACEAEAQPLEEALPAALAVATHDSKLSQQAIGNAVLWDKIVMSSL